MQMPGADYFSQRDCSTLGRHGRLLNIREAYRAVERPQTTPANHSEPPPIGMASDISFGYIRARNQVSYYMKRRSFRAMDVLNTLVDSPFGWFLVCYLHNNAKGGSLPHPNRKGSVGRYR